MKTVNQYLKNKTKYDKELEEESKKRPRIRTVREVAKENGIELGELTSEKSSKGFFKDSKAFDDGYQFGDLTKTVFSTGGDLMTNISQGFIGGAEGIADTGQYLLADTLNFFGQKKAAEAVKKNAQFNSTAAIFGKNEKKEDNFVKGWTDKLDENSISGDTLDTVMQGVGQVGAMAGSSYLIGGGAEVGANATKLQKAGALAKNAFVSYTSAYGNARSEAYKNGADDSTANKAGMINGFSEAIAEQFFNGLPGYKSAGWFSKVNGKIGGKIEKVLGTKIGRTFLKLSDTMGEGAEEMISNALNSLGTDITHYIGTKTGKEYNYGMENLSGNAIKDMVNSFTSEDSLESFFSAALTSALIGGGNTFLSNFQKNTILKEYAKENNITIQQAEKQLNATIESQMPNLPFEEKVEQQERLQKQELINMKNGNFVSQEIDSETPNLPTDKKNQRFYFNSSKITDEFEKSVYESAKKSLNNTEQTHKFVDKVAQIAKDKKTNYGFINNEELKTSGHNIEGKEIGGLVATDENGQKQILINIDSSKALNSIVGHETTHLLEGTKEYQELQQSIFEYAKQKGDFEGRQQTLSELYKDVENADINSEITADLVGDYLFTDEKFINSLSTNKPSLFQKIKDLIDDLIVRFKGTKEEKLLREVQKKFKAAYKQDGNLESDKYMMIGKNGAKNLSKNSNDNYYKNLNDNLKKAQKEYNDNNDLEQENIKSKGKYQWFKTKYGDWGTFISDKKSKLKKRLEPNHTYKLSEILDHDLLYKAYPELKNLKVETADIASTGGLAKTKFVPINTITDIVYLRNSDLNEKNFKYTLLHEINHYIEFKEKYDKNSRGADSKTIGREAYKNNLGELISNTTKMNANLTQEQLNDIILPEIAKKNPKYENIKDNLDKINELERKEAPKNDSKYANETKEKQIQNNKKNGNKTIRQTDNNDRLKGIYDYEQNKFINNKDFYEELDDSSFSLSQDNQGRKLSEQQQEYFKDSKARDENGNLIELYHGTPNDFTRFNYDKLGTNGTLLGKGFYLTDDINVSEAYANKSENGKIMKLYADIKKPLKWGETTISKQQYQKFVEAINEATNGTLFADYSGEYSEKGSKEYNSTLNDILMDYEYGGDDIDLVSGILNTTGMSWEEGYKILKDTTGYDGIIVKKEVYDSGEGNVYIPFLPNQIKNVDNTNPTIDDDIRYSLPTAETKQYGNYNVYGEDIKYQKPSEVNLPTSEKTDENLPLKREIPKDPTKESSYDFELSDVAKRTVKNKLEKAIQNQTAKAINTATKVGNKYLDFTKAERTEFKEQLKRYSGLTREDLMNPSTYNEIKSILQQYADKELNYTNRELSDVQQELREKIIKIDDNLKKQIQDYGNFKKENFGNLKLSKDGQSIDSIWQELSDEYPHYFDKEVTSEADMLYQMAEFMKQDATITEKYRIDDDTIGEATAKVFNSLVNNTMNNEQIQSMQNYLDDKAQARTRQVVQEELLTEMGITDSDISAGNDINHIDMQRTDPIRLNEKVFGHEIGKKINDATINKTKHNEAERIRFLNKEREEIKSLGIKPRSKESAAVQKYAEKKYINQYGEEVQYGDQELMSEFDDDETREKIKHAAEVLRNKYDYYIDKTNQIITSLGYDPIKKRTDYMRHFQALDDVFSRFGMPLNRESLKSNELPTDINGLTDQFKPGKNWFASALERTGEKSSYDAITGIDGYLDGVTNLMYHTEDIQRYRALSKFIRQTFGKEKGFDNLGGLTEEETAQRIKDIQDNKLSSYVAWLDEQANSIAGKKGGIDRAAERIVGRKIYSVLDTAKKQVGSNMTGFNVRSALTNFASSIQAASKTNKLAFIKGTISTFKNIVHNDGLIDKSDFLTSRFGSNQLSSKLWQKISNAGQILMTGSDYFTSNQIWRSKYYENLSKGMNEQYAIKDADDFASRIMGDRSKGSTAEIFNSKTLGLLTQFQLEVNNQWSSLVHDNKMDIKRGKKLGAMVVFQLGQLAAASYFFNNIMKSLTGSDVMIDPIDMLMEMFGGNDDDDDETTLEQRAQKVIGDVVNNLPFASFLTGGRIPMSEAFNGLGTFGKKITGQTDQFGNEIEWSDVKKDIIESGAYWLLPTGYGQIRKTSKGLSMYDENLPVAGSYTNSGNLRFEADDSTFGKVQAALFGEYASKNARNYFDKGYSPLKEKQINEALDANLPIDEYREINKGIKEAKATAKENEESQSEAEYDYIYNLPISMEQKNSLLNSKLGTGDEITDKNGYVKYKDSKDNIYWVDEESGTIYNNKYRESNINKDSLTKYSNKKDLTNYGDYGSLEEFNYANNNPTKYSVVKQITDYSSFKNYKDDIASIKQEYSDGTTRGSKIAKQQVYQYINSLNLNKYQKLMLEKMAGGYSIKSYKSEMRQYIESLSLTKEEKQAIDKELFG